MTARRVLLRCGAQGPAANAPAVAARLMAALPNLRCCVRRTTVDGQVGEIEVEVVDPAATTEPNRQLAEVLAQPRFAGWYVVADGQERDGRR